MAKEGYHPKIASLLEEYWRGDEPGALVRYLSSNSNLPGPRANLELLEDFSSELRSVCKAGPSKFWRLSVQLTDATDEFVAMCGVRGVGQVGGCSDSYFARAMTRLQSTASDSRWRVREAVAMSVQGLITDRPETVGKLGDWVETGDWFVMRAAAAGIAEPRLLRNVEVAGAALALHRRILERLMASRDRKSEGLESLRKCLAYSLSVVVAATPDEGFPFLRDLMVTKDADVRRICRQNLKKNRLRSKFPLEVVRLEKLLA
jgi:hypothetical protein